MKVLIVSVNQNRTPLPVMPGGACMAAEAALRAGHDTRVLDFMFDPDPLERLEGELKAFRPDVIGISVRNIDNNDLQSPVLFVAELLPVMEGIRRASEAPVVLGGPGLSIMPGALLRFTGADFAVTGGAGPAFPALLERLARGEPDIPRIFRHEGRENAGGQAEDVSRSFCFPDFPRWIDCRAYAASLAPLPLKTKTGCEFQCVYCTYDMIDGRNRTLCDPEMVAEAVERYIGLGFQMFEFTDNVFNSPYEHALALCEAISRSGIRAGFECMDLNPLRLDDTLLEEMECAGFRGMGMTVESASDPVLNAFKKGFTADHVYRAAEAIRRHRIPCMWFFMMGGPGETRETVEETLQFARRQIRAEDPAYFTIGIRIYPGTPLERLARTQGLLPESADDLLHPVFYLSPATDADWLMRRMRKETAERMNFLIAGEASFAWSPWVLRMGRILRMKPPLWQYVRPLRRGMRFLNIGSP